MIRAGTRGIWWNQLKRKLTRFFRAYNSSNIWYSIIREFCVYANLRRLGEKFVKLINVVRLLVFFSLGPPYVARLFRGAQFGGRKLCSWVNTPLMQMEFLKYCIIRTGDSMRYYLSERFFLVWNQFYRGLFMRSLKCKFLFPSTEQRWAAR